MPIRFRLFVRILQHRKYLFQVCCTMFQQARQVFKIRVFVLHEICRIHLRQLRMIRLFVWIFS